jgi:LysM repeat protein
LRGGKFMKLYVKLLIISLALALPVSLACFAQVVRAQSSCGPTYTVRPGDMLARIAQQCDTTVEALLNANPNITNPNRIRVGQVIQMPDASMQPPENSVPGDPQALLVPSSGPAGTEVEVRVSGFPANQEVALALGVEGAPPLDEMTATTNAQGRLQTTITIPTTAQVGERWVVTVEDTGPAGTEATSNVFLAGTGEESVAISPTSGPAGTEIQVDASGFIPNIPVNVGIGRQGAEPVEIQQAQSDAQGNVETTIALPDTAESGSNWIVVAGTQGWRITALSESFSVTGEVVDGDPDEDIVMHTVQRGEWLHRIARRYNTTVTKILAANPAIANPNQIRVGQEIRIPTPDVSPVTRVNIYLIAVGDGGQRGPEIGCNDSVVAVEVEIAPTVAPLQAALERLFVDDGDNYGLSNVLTRSELAVEDVNIRDGEAIIYLTGQLSIGGVCDHPRVEAQLGRTALQFDTVDSVSIFINGEPLSEVLSLR